MVVGLRDRPPMLVTGKYAQWQSRFIRYVDTKPNGEALRKCILQGLYKLSNIIIPGQPATEKSPEVPKQTTIETFSNISPENKDHYDAEKEAIHLLLTGIGDESYSTFDACKTAHDMWIPLKGYNRYQKEVNEIHAEKIARNANPLALVAATQQYPNTYYQAPKPHKSYAPPSKQSSYTISNASTRHKGKEIVKPITPPSKNKNVDTTPRYVNENHTGQFGNQRPTTVAGAKETVGSQIEDMDEEVDEQELEAHYSFMAKIQENIKKYQNLKKKPISIAQARKNMIIYLKNMAGYKMEHFREMTYDKDSVAHVSIKVGVGVGSCEGGEGVFVGDGGAGALAFQLLLQLETSFHIVFGVNRSYKVSHIVTLRLLRVTTTLSFKVVDPTLGNNKWIQQYLQNEHYALWEVIEFGDFYKAPQEVSDTSSASEGFAKKKGRTVTATTEDMQKRRNDAAILKTFGGNEATKKTKKNQLKQQYGNFKSKGTETLKETFNRLRAINMAFISSAKNSNGKGEVNTASIPTASTQVSPASANVAAASISHDTVCAYIASQSNGSQIKYKDINQIDEYDIEEMDIKWNMALLSHFARECRAPRSQDRGRRENFKQGSKVEESAPKALMAIDGVGCDWSYIANEEENHALVVDGEALTEFTLMAKSISENEGFDNSLCSKSCKKNTDSLNTKYTDLREKLSDNKKLKFNVESKNNRIERLTNELEELKKEKEGLDSKLIGFQSASKDLGTLLGSQRSDKNKEGLGYNDGNPQQDLKDKGVIDSGCSRYMTGYISFLSDFEDINRGYLAFGGNPKGGKISDFEDINRGYLAFGGNPKGGKISDTDCVVLSSDYKMPDKNHVLLLHLIILTLLIPCNNWLIIHRHGKSVNIKQPLGPIPATLEYPTKNPSSAFPSNFPKGSRVLRIVAGHLKGLINPILGDLPSKVGKETVSAQQYVLLPLWSTGSQDPQNTDDDVVDAAFDVKENKNDVHVSANGSDDTANKKHDEKFKIDDKGKRHVDSPTGVRDLRAEFKEFSFNSTNRVNTVSAPVNAVGPNLTNSTNRFNNASPYVNVVSLNFEIARKSLFVDPSKYPDDPNMPKLEDIVYSEDVGTEADLSNLETNIPVSTIPTTRVYKDHLVNQIIADLNLSPQTRSMTRMGHTQEEGIDYDEVFAPLARIEAIRLFLAYASFMGFMVYQMDVKSNFPYETIEEEVYVSQPLGFEDPDYPDKVYKVVKALYGLHQA
nr:copia protein [Tanacetum cinerariifolium]